MQLLNKIFPIKSTWMVCVRQSVVAGVFKLYNVNVLKEEKNMTLKDFSSILSIAFPSNKLNPQLYLLYKTLNYESC